MKVDVHYVARHMVTVDMPDDAPPSEMKQIADWHARNKHGLRTEVTQILPHGTPSQALADQPAQPTSPGGPGGAPPTGPKAPAGDQLLARAA